MNIFSPFLSLWNYSNLKIKKGFVVALFLIVLNGIFESLTLSLVLPILSDILGANSLPINIYLSPFQFADSRFLKLLILALLIIIVALSGLFRGLSLQKHLTYAASVGTFLSIRSYSNYLSMDYQAFSSKNSAAYVTLLVTKISNCVSAINSFLQFLSSIFLCTAICLTLAFVNFSVFFFVLSISAITYIPISIISSKAAVLNSNKIASLSVSHYKTLNEGFSNFLQIKFSSQKIFLEMFETVDRQIRLLQASNNLLMLFPKIFIETLIMLALILSAFSFVLLKGETNDLIRLIPLAAVYAVAIQKIFPTIQNIYAAVTKIKSTSADLQEVVRSLALPTTTDTEEKLKLEKGLTISHVTFSYPNLPSPVLSELNLFLPKGSIVGIMGETGSGKSTFIELLMGILKPLKGSIAVDESNIYSNPEILKLYQKSIGYVPQHIYLADNSFAYNIAFGQSDHEYDMERIIKSSKIALLNSFVESLPAQYLSSVGEAGKNLSGGQIQRLGIARALYQEPQILVLDECTSALDTVTEQALLRSMKSSLPEITQIFVTHKPSTLSYCDLIYKIEDGNIIPLS